MLASIISNDFVSGNVLYSFSSVALPTSSALTCSAFIGVLVNISIRVGAAYAAVGIKIAAATIPPINRFFMVIPLLFGCKY
ncbi:hypothetical protein D3C76_1508670 [compost metagenome]